MVNFLELFSGSCKVSAEAERRGYDVRNLDISNINSPTYCCDILDWDYKKDLGDWKPDIIWASPDCRSWSLASNCRHRTDSKHGLEPKTQIGRNGNAMVLKTLEIIDHFKPKYFFIENPRCLLRHFPPMKDLPYRNTVYYGNWDYPMCKATDIFSNIKLPDEKRPSKDLFEYAPNGNNKVINKTYSKKKNERSLIPIKLISFILDQLTPSYPNYNI